MGRHTEVGKEGEAVARDYLEKKGYRVITQNWRTKYGEIDLIALHQGVLIFIEVRTKTHERFGIPEESINTKKQSRMINNAQAYMAIHRHRGPSRIDAVCVVLGHGSPARIDHYENITS